MTKSFKVYSIGIDGLEPTIVDHYINFHKSYAFKYINDHALTYRIYSTDPPMSPPAWSSIISGLSIDKHKIFDFYKYNKYTNELRLVTSDDIPITIFDIMNDLGLKQLLINIPFLYPPRVLKGVVVSGLPASLGSIYTYPKSLGDQLLKKNFNIGEPAWSRRIRVVEKSIIDRSIFTIKLTELEKWDFLMTVYRETDITQHFYWDRRSLLISIYRLIDKMLLAPLIDKIRDEREDAVIMVYGDHGFTKGEGVLNILDLLYRENLYTFDETVNRVIKIKLFSIIEQIYSSRWTTYFMGMLQNLYLKGFMKHLGKISVRNSPLYSVGSIMDGGGYLYINPKYNALKAKIYKVALKKLLGCNVIERISLLNNKKRFAGVVPDLKISLKEGFIYYPYYSGNGVLSDKVPPARKGTHRRETRLYYVLFKDGEPISVEMQPAQILRVEDIGSIMLFSNRILPPSFIDGTVPSEIRNLISKNYGNKFKKLNPKNYVKYKSRLTLLH